MKFKIKKEDLTKIIEKQQEIIRHVEKKIEPKIQEKQIFLKTRVR